MSRAAADIVNGKTHATSWAELEPYHITQGYDNMACSCCGKIYVSFAILCRFKLLRETYGKALRITSGYRCNKLQTYLYNRASAEEKAAGLVAKPGSSPHEYGEALDVVAPNGHTPKTWGSYIWKLMSKAGLGIRIGCLRYTSFAHIDTMNLVNPSKGTGILW